MFKARGGFRTLEGVMRDSVGQNSYHKHAAIRLGDRKFACDLMLVQEVIPEPRLDPCLDCSQLLVGMFEDTRGSLPVLDLMNRPPDECQLCDMALVVVEVAGQVLGILVDQVLDIVEFDPADLLPIPGGACGVDEHHVSGVVVITDTDYYLLDLHRIVDTYLGSESVTGAETGEEISEK